MQSFEAKEADIIVKRYGDLVDRAMRVDEQQVFGKDHHAEIEDLLTRLKRIPEDQHVVIVSAYIGLLKCRTNDTDRVYGF